MTDSKGQPTRDERGAYVSRAQRTKLANRDEHTTTQTLSNPLADVPTDELKALQPEGIRAELARRIEADAASVTDNTEKRAEATEASAQASAELQERMETLNASIETACAVIEGAYAASEAAKTARKLAVKHGGTPSVLNDGRAWVARMGPGGVVTPENANLYERLARAVKKLGSL